MPPDFSRDVFCVLGLPFDAIDEAQATSTIRHAAHNGTRCFFSTPNLNFAIQALSDPEFRASVLQSDLSVADGWPIAAIARLLRIPLPGRVAGSGVFERLRRTHPSAGPLSVYFFGGPEGAGQAARERLNADAGGLTGVGFHAPGFGSVEQMSTAPVIEQLNAAQPDFLVVALGAKKGQAWILRNLARLDAPVIGHLGAVINFTAGTVARAPQWVQRLRLEWLWRVKEEPDLWRRYVDDGLALMRLLATRVIPAAVSSRTLRMSPDTPAATHAEVAHEQTLLQLSGSWTHANAQPLRTLFHEQAARETPVAIDLGRVEYIDAAAIGLLSLLYGWQIRPTLGWRVVAASTAVRRALKLACASYLLEPFPAAAATDAR